MSNKELPAPAGAEQSSVFSVFGFRSNQPANEALDTPVATHNPDGSQTPFESSVISDLRHLRQKQIRSLEEEQKLSQIPPEPARKLNSTLQEQTKVTTQAIIDQSDKNLLAPKGTLYNFARRYSRPQVSSTEETFDANTLIQKFNSSLNFSGNTQNRAPSDVDSDSEPEPHVLQRYFGRRRSSPDVATLSQLRSSNLQVASRISSQTLVESSTESQMSKGMDKSASYSNLQAAAGKDSVAKPSLHAPAVQDSVDAASADSSSNSGFGIFSRTRKFGAWLTKATEGEKVEVTKKDLNAFAPTSF